MNLLTPARVGWAIALVFSAGVVAVASLPTGAPIASGAVPSGARVAAEQPLGAVRVYAIAYKNAIRAEVAYHGEKGWFGVLLDDVFAGRVELTPIATATTTGKGPIPALSAIYGRVPPDVDAAHVEVQWRDGTTTKRPVRDRVFVVARRAVRRAAIVRFIDSAGTVGREVAAP